MLENSYSELPERFYERTNPQVYNNAEAILFNQELAAELGLGSITEEDFLKASAGLSTLPGSQPIALAYAGAQFGHFVPQLGDGRAHLLGEIHGVDIQLKGSGQTRFSRQGDGRSALGPVIREFLVSEGMHYLGVPTTRSLCAITTGEKVLRQYGPEPGGVLMRVADSHIRVGTFEYFAYQSDHEALEILTEYALRRHYPEIHTETRSERCLQLLQAFAERQGNLVAQWYGLGFIHGVMNTDNCSVAGITLDYGPCAFMDEFQFQKVFSSIDAQGRYAYGNQMPIVEWNILRLAECLLPLIDDDQKIASSKVEEALEQTLKSFPVKIYQQFGQKLGIENLPQGEESIVVDFLRYLELHALDFTLSFSNIKTLYEGNKEYYPDTAELKAFLQKWESFKPEFSHHDCINPKLIPRNHQIQRVIDLAYQGDYQLLHEMWQALKSPYEVADQHTQFITPPEPAERIYQTFCGT